MSKKSWPFVLNDAPGWMIEEDGWIGPWFKRIAMPNAGRPAQGHADHFSLFASRELTEGKRQGEAERRESEKRSTPGRAFAEKKPWDA